MESKLFHIEKQDKKKTSEALSGYDWNSRLLLEVTEKS